MSRQLHLLSARTVATAKPGRHTDGGGLYLVVADTGSRKWVFRYTFAGQRIDLGLGGASEGGTSLKEARDKADEFRRMIRTGKDPKAARECAPVPTFGEFADIQIATMRAQWKNAKHAAQWVMTLTVHAAPLRDLTVDAIGTDDVLGVLKPLWNKTPETAKRLQGRIENVLAAAKAAGHRTGENPAQWRGHLDKLLPKRQRLTRGHHAALPYMDLPAFMADLRNREATAALVLEFLILTATRSGETLGTRWREIDLDKATWIIPAERMKAGREHRVPLSVRALAILEAMKPLKEDDDSFVFPGARKGSPLSAMGMTMLLRRMQRGNITPHGFRSAFRDWAAETTGFPHEVCEMALAHMIKDKAEAAYRRGDLFDKRRRLMEAWSAYCEPKNANVVELRRL